MGIHHIIDNQLALRAGWDEELLRLELQEVAATDFDLDLIGFSDDGRSRLAGKASRDAGPGFASDPERIRLLAAEERGIKVVAKVEGA